MEKRLSGKDTKWWKMHKKEQSNNQKFKKRQGIERMLGKSCLGIVVK